MCLCKGLLQLCFVMMVQGTEQRETFQNRNATFLSSLYSSRFLPATALPAHRNQQDKHTHQPSVSAAQAPVHAIALVNRTRSGFGCTVKTQQKALSTRQSTVCDIKCCGDRQNAHPQHASAFSFMLMELH